MNSRSCLIAVLAALLFILGTGGCGGSPLLDMPRPGESETGEGDAFDLDASGDSDRAAGGESQDAPADAESPLTDGPEGEVAEDLDSDPGDGPGDTDFIEYDQVFDDPEPEGDAPDGTDTPDGDAAEADWPPAAKLGSIILQQGLYRNNANLFGYASAVASFQNVPAGDAGIVPTECTVTLYDPNPKPADPWLSAGTISVTGAHYGGFTLTAKEVAPFGWYYSSGLPGTLETLYLSGDAITVSAAGGPDVPAFEAAFTAQSPVWGMDPYILDGGFSWTPASATSFTWTAGTGRMIFIASAYKYNGAAIASGGSVTCLTADDGAFAFPPQTLSNLPADAPVVTLAVMRDFLITVRAGDTDVGVGNRVLLSRTWDTR